MEGYLGQIIMFGGNFAPRQWAFCNGQLLAIAQNTALFSILGTTYGGDGRTTFGLPDLRGRVAISAGQGPGLPSYRLGQRGGQPTVTLSTNNLPPHNHTASGTQGVAKGPGDSNNPENRVPAQLVRENAYASGPVDSKFIGDSVSVSVGNTGGGQSFSNMPPYTAVNFIICLQGIFPSRN